MTSQAADDRETLSNNLAPTAYQHEAQASALNGRLAITAKARLRPVANEPEQLMDCLEIITLTNPSTSLDRSMSIKVTCDQCDREYKV